jgi:asparagine synthase (glutamine-hydrolysing)
MCGIFGWVLAGSRRQNYDVLVSTTDLMAHRGPDGSGYWIGDGANKLHQIGLGHRRLSIIDIQGGAQPMWSADQTIVLVFNGEIYNYVELRKELIDRGHILRTSSDTEVIIEAYKAWGPGAVAKFRGMFALLLWDIKKQCLLLARDQFGKKPLFISEMSDAWIFGSEIEPIMQFQGVDRALDHDAFKDYLLNRYVPGPSTLFRGVKKLPPGCYALWQDGRFSITRYFIPPFATTSPDVTDFNDAVQMFRETLEESVSIRMRSDAPFGAFLSGGVDSSAIVGIMARQISKVRTFSVGFRESKYSELEFARVIAQRFDTDHHEVVVDPDMFMEHWPMAVLRRGAPLSSEADVPILILSKLASRSVKMVLTGEGSDELMGGYPKHRAERWIQWYHRIMPSALHDGVIRPGLRALPYAMRRTKIIGMAAGERELTNRMRAWFGGITLEDRNALIGQAVPSEPGEPYPFSIRTGSTMRRALFFDQTSWLPDNLLERGDRMMMAGSIEGRMPFMDTMLAALVSRFPDSFLIGKFRGKLILRAAMEKVLPKEILFRKKVGFRIPVDEWFRGAYRDFVRDMLISDASQINRICSSAVISQLVNEHLERRANNEKTLWSLVNLELFLRTFKLTGIDAIRARAA